MTDQRTPHPCACSSGPHMDPGVLDWVVVPGDAVLALLAAWSMMSPRHVDALDRRERLAAADDGYDTLCELLGVST